jgi:hypothetical protein
LISTGETENQSFGQHRFPAGENLVIHTLQRRWNTARELGIGDVVSGFGVLWFGGCAWRGWEDGGEEGMCPQIITKSISLLHSLHRRRGYNPLPRRLPLVCPGSALLCFSLGRCDRAQCGDLMLEDRDAVVFGSAGLGGVVGLLWWVRGRFGEMRWL